MQGQLPQQQYKVVPFAEYKQREEFEKLLNTMYNGEYWRFLCVVESAGLIVFGKMR